MADSGYKSISRLDSPKKGAHGWYVRVKYNGQIYAKFFSDSHYESRKESLQAAVEYRDQLEKQIGKPRTERVVASITGRNHSGIRGVQRITRTAAGYRAYQVSWSPEPGKPMRTSVSIDKYGEKEALRRAIEIRQEKELEIYGRVLPPKPVKRKRRKNVRQSTP